MKVLGVSIITLAACFVLWAGQARNTASQQVATQNVVSQQIKPSPAAMAAPPKTTPVEVPYDEAFWNTYVQYSALQSVVDEKRKALLAWERDHNVPADYVIDPTKKALVPPSAAKTPKEAK
jgi:hypothetical protein